MSTCNRLYYVSKICLRLLRKYTNEIYPNDTSKIERFQMKKRPAEGDDRNETQICNLKFIFTSIFNYFLSMIILFIFLRWRYSNTRYNKAENIEVHDVKQFGRNNFNEPKETARGKSAVG